VARLESEQESRSDRLARACEWLFIAAFAVFFSAFALTKHQAFQTHGFDLGNYDQTVWNTLHGHPLACTNWPPFGESRLAFHVEPVLFLVAPLYLLHEGPETLLVLQAVVAGLGAWPVARIARRRLNSPWAGPLFAALYLLYPAVEAGPVSEFHAVVLAPAFLAMALYSVEQERYGHFVLWGFLAGTCKEEIPLLVAMMGLYLILRRRRWKLGLTTFLVCVAWFLVAVQVVIPHFNAGGRSAHLGRYSYLGDGLLDIVVNVVRQPGLLGEVFRDPLRQAYLWRIPLPMGYLSLLAPEVLLLAAPTVAINALSMYPAMVALDFLQYSAVIAPFAVVAAVYGMERLLALANRLWPEADRRFVRFLTLVLSGYLVLVSLGYHRVFGHTPLGRMFEWPGVTEHHRIGREVLRDIPRDAAVSAQMSLNPHLSQRRWVFVFPEFEQAEYVALDISAPCDSSFEASLEAVTSAGAGYYSGDPSITHMHYQRQVSDLLNDADFGVVQARDGFLVLKRGAPHVQVPQALYSPFLESEVLPDLAMRVNFGDRRELVGLATEYLPGAGRLIHTYWRGGPTAGDRLHVYLVLVDLSVRPGSVLAAQELFASAFVQQETWASGLEIHDQVFVLFPSDPQLHALGLMAGTDRTRETIMERLPVSIESGSAHIRADVEARLLLLNADAFQ
jgi:uncharacterized membrane protein